MKTDLHPPLQYYTTNHKGKKMQLTDLLFSLCFLDIVSSHFDPWGQDGSGKLHYIHTQQMTQLLSSWETDVKEYMYSTLNRLVKPRHKKLKRNYFFKNKLFNKLKELSQYCHMSTVLFITVIVTIPDLFCLVFGNIWPSCISSIKLMLLPHLLYIKNMECQIWKNWRAVPKFLQV